MENRRKSATYRGDSALASVQLPWPVPSKYVQRKDSPIAKNIDASAGRITRLSGLLTMEADRFEIMTCRATLRANARSNGLAAAQWVAEMWPSA